MPGVDTAGPSAGGDELDDLFNYDIDVDAVFKDIEDKAEEQSKATKPANGKGADLGIDEEVQIKRARKPIAKLDEPRLLSDRGIPKLRKITKDKLRFKGKGHEFSDIARMLNMYQLWLDDLYPRAKFLDSLAMVEKLGHAKSMQVRRKDWINEDKPKDPYSDMPEPTDEVNQNGSMPGDQNAASEAPQPDEASVPLGMPDNEPDNIFLSDDEAPTRGNEPDEDELDALLDEENHRSNARQEPPQASPVRQQPTNSGPAEDELDALLAEHEADAEKENRREATAPKLNTSKDPAPGDFADEMEAMAEFDMW